MKIFAYEVREDEEAFFDRVQETLPMELLRSEGALNADTIGQCGGCQGITILGHSQLDRKLLAQLKQMGVRVVSTRTVGCNHIDLAAAKELGIAICNTSYGSECVADYTVMLLLLSLRNYKPALWRMQVNDYSLSGLQGRQVSSLTIGILGTGRIGVQVMKDLQGFGCRFLCYDPYPNPTAAELGSYVPLEQIWAECDVITLHMPLTQDNFHIINRETLAKMKKGVILINTARGQLMDIDAVIEAVESQQIGRLAMDVFEDEEGIYHEDLRNSIIKNRNMAYLRQFPNVVMTPHIAFYTQEAVESMVYGGVRSVYEMLTQGTASNRVV